MADILLEIGLIMVQEGRRMHVENERDRHLDLAVHALRQLAVVGLQALDVISQAPHLQRRPPARLAPPQLGLQVQDEGLHLCDGRLGLVLVRSQLLQFIPAFPNNQQF